MLLKMPGVPSASDARQMRNHPHAIGAVVLVLPELFVQAPGVMFLGADRPEERIGQQAIVLRFWGGACWL